MHGDQVLHRFQKSKLMLYNSVPKTKTTTETFLQDYLKRIRESDYIEIPLQIWKALLSVVWAGSLLSSP